MKKKKALWIFEEVKTTLEKEEKRKKQNSNRMML